MRRMRQKGVGWVLPVGLSLLVNLLLFSLFGRLFESATPQTTVFEVTRSQPCTLIVTSVNVGGSERLAKIVEKNISPLSPSKRCPSGQVPSSGSRPQQFAKLMARPVSLRASGGGDEETQKGVELSGGGESQDMAQAGSGGSGGLRGVIASGEGNSSQSEDSRNGGGEAYGAGGQQPGESREACVLDKTPPPYPPEARDEGVEGTTVLEILLSASGQIKRVATYVSSGDQRLDRAAEEAVRRWRFSPRLHEGAPQEASLRIQVSFQLE